MLIITINEKDYELRSTIGIGKQLEFKFKRNLNEIATNLGSANIDEIIGILAIAADKQQDLSFKKEIEDSDWGYLDLIEAAGALISHLMFRGTPEEIEGKINKYPVSEEQKNVIREQLGIPLKDLTVPVPGVLTTGTES